MEEIYIIRSIEKILTKDSLTEFEKQEVLLNNDVMDYIITRTNSKTFSIIINLLGNPIEYIEQRNALEKNAIRNINNIDISQAKDVISQIYFGDYATNILLTIETILERIDSNNSFKNNLDNNIIIFLRNLQSFLKNKDNIISIDDFVRKIDLYQEELKLTNNTIATLIEKMFLLAQKDFAKEIEINLNAIKIFEGINPNIIKNKYGQDVQLYTLQNQTECQQKFYLLTRTNTIKEYMSQENACEEYLKDKSQRDYLSYSLINAERYSGFASKYRITFGYFTMGNNSIMSANTHDGQTKQYTLKENFYVIKQQYLGLNEFISKTDSYNEIVLKNDKILIPNCIIVNEASPSEKIINIAANMNLPIIYMNPQYYKKHEPINPVSAQEKIDNWYRHDNYLDYSLSSITKTNIQNK